MEKFDELTKEERYLIECWRKLNEQGKSAVMCAADGFSKMPEYMNKCLRFIPRKQFRPKV